MLSSLTRSRSLPSMHSWPVKSFTLSFGSSTRTLPRRRVRSAAGEQSSPRSDALSLGASRIFVSDSPSSGFVFTQHCPGGSEARSSSRSAGKYSRVITRTTSPTITSAHVSRTHSLLAPSDARRMSTWSGGGAGGWAVGCGAGARALAAVVGARLLRVRLAVGLVARHVLGRHHHHVDEDQERQRHPRRRVAVGERDDRDHLHRADAEEVEVGEALPRVQQLVQRDRHEREQVEARRLDQVAAAPGVRLEDGDLALEDVVDGRRLLRDDLDRHGAIAAAQRRC